MFSRVVATPLHPMIVAGLVSLPYAMATLGLTATEIGPAQAQAMSDYLYAHPLLIDSDLPR